MYEYMTTYQIKNLNSAKIYGVKICIISTDFKTTLALFLICQICNCYIKC